MPRSGPHPQAHPRPSTTVPEEQNQPPVPTALALVEGNRGGWAGGGRAGGVQARRTDGGWRLYGQVDQVLDGHSAGLLLVPAHAGGYARSRTLVALVAADAKGADPAVIWRWNTTGTPPAHHRLRSPETQQAAVHRSELPPE